MTAPSAWAIEQALSVWHSTRQRLLAEDTDLAHDEAALTAMLGDAEADVQTILQRTLDGALHAASMAEAATTRANDIKARADRYKRRAETLRGMAFAIMDAIGERRVELPHLTATIRQGTPSAVITDDTAIPEDYVRTTRAPDKAAILAALKSGATLPGAELSNGLPSLAIRSK